MDQQLNQQNQKVMPSSYLALSIISAFFSWHFAWPFAILAIIKATKVERLWYQGQYNEAVEASKHAKMWSIIALVVCGVGMLLLYMLYFVLIFLSVVAEEM